MDLVPALSLCNQRFLSSGLSPHLTVLLQSFYCSLDHLVDQSHYSADRATVGSNVLILTMLALHIDHQLLSSHWSCKQCTIESLWKKISIPINKLPCRQEANEISSRPFSPTVPVPSRLKATFSSKGKGQEFSTKLSTFPGKTFPCLHYCCLSIATQWKENFCTGPPCENLANVALPVVECGHPYQLVFGWQGTRF